MERLIATFRSDHVCRMTTAAVDEVYERDAAVTAN